MIIGDLLELDDLDIGVAWAPPELLRRRVTGVTSTDLQDPARYLQPGELVLSGLVWWQPDQTSAALRFANALRSAGVAALLAGETTHGEVPQSLVDACRTHGIPLLSVPTGTSFRAVTDRVYLRLWGDLQARSQGVAAIPGAARQELDALLRANTPLADVLARAVVRLGLPDCSIVSAGGRVLAGPGARGTSAPGSGPGPGSGAGAGAGSGKAAGSGSAARSGSGSAAGAPGALAIGPQGDSPFEGWLLQPQSEPGSAASAVLQGLAELFTPVATRARAEAAAQRQVAGRLVELLSQDGAGLTAALTECGLPVGPPLVPVTARIDGASASWAVAALAEALHQVGAPFATATDGQGGATALVAASATRVTSGLRAALPALQSHLLERQLLRIRIGPATVPAAGPLRSALVEAAYALEAGHGGTVGSSGELTSLAALLQGIPIEVTAAFHARLLGPLADHDRENGTSLLTTLSNFLDQDGSWARTAKALHIHVNTVHYRIRRVEELTGRSLARLEDRIDLRAALLCTPARSRQTG